MYSHLTRAYPCKHDAHSDSPNPNHPNANHGLFHKQGSASVQRDGGTLVTHHSHDAATGAALCPLFGEQSLLEDADMNPHTAALVAAGPCKLLVLHRCREIEILRDSFARSIEKHEAWRLV